MLGKAFAGLTAGKELLFPRFSQYADHLQGVSFFFETAFDTESGRAFVNAKLILPGKIAFGEAEVINGVEQVGFSNAIAAANTYDPL